MTCANCRSSFEVFSENLLQRLHAMKDEIDAESRIGKFVSAKIEELELLNHEEAEDEVTERRISELIEFENNFLSSQFH